LALSDLFNRRRKDESDAGDVGADRSPVYPTKALAHFLGTLSARAQPVLLDLGPVIGQNVTFFGEQLGCKILVEDVYSDVDRHVREGKVAELPAFFEKRFSHADNSVDGILCWDVFDYLDRPSAQALAHQLARILRPDGALLAFFATGEAPPGPATYTKHLVVDQATLRHRPYPAARAKQRPHLNRDIIRMFEPLRVSEQFLLKTNLREVLLRKPVGTSGSAAGV
jgi:SAM-dependent methyltransferase